MDLRVHIPIEYKLKLEARYNPDRAWYDEIFGVYRIRGDCELCREFLDKEGTCRNCFFSKVEGLEDEVVPCMSWLLIVVGDWPVGLDIKVDELCWVKRVDTKVREWLKKLREKAEKLIIWDE
jgi:hypothetical protein